VTTTTKGAPAIANREGAHAPESRLISEIERYLAAVECFRRLGCEPRWRT